MSFEKKLDDIRKKPEHIRQRYVLISVIICMLFVILIWFFTIKTNFSESSSNSSNTFTEIQDQFNESGEELPTMPSIEDYISTEPQEDTNTQEILESPFAQPTLAPVTSDTMNNNRDFRDQAPSAEEYY